MRQYIVISCVFLGITAIALGTNIVLFSFFPLLHRFFSDTIISYTAPQKQTEVVMEYKKPEKKEPVQEQRPLKQTVSKIRGKTTKKMQFRFTPDLSVEGSGAVTMEEEELAAVVFEEGEIDEPLVPLYRPNLTFSARARELEIEGVLELILVIDEQGKVASIDIVRTPHPIISNEARKVISKWRFKPAKHRGVPVRVRRRQIVEFTLD